MKLLVSYNVYDGEELLEYSIRAIREVVDHINVVFQSTSNWGSFNPNVKKVIQDLYNKGLIDSFIEYSPIPNISPHINEITKRQFGLWKAKELGMTHYLSMDADEFYDLEEFKKAKEIIEDNDYEATILHVVEYTRLPIYKKKALWIHNVPFIYKILPNSSFSFEKGLGGKTVDPTRICNFDSKKIHLFDDSIIKMNHMITIRKNLFSKWANSSSRNDIEHNIPKLVDEVRNFLPNNDYEIVDNKWKIPYENWDL